MWRVILVSVGLWIAGCSTTTPQATDRSTAPEAVLDTVWQWEATVGTNDTCAVPTPERYTLHFLPEDKIEAQFDCNSGSGSYTISRGVLSFGPLISTRMACPPDSLDARYMQDLQQVVAFFVEDDALHLQLSDNGGTMRFRRENQSTRRE